MEKARGPKGDGNVQNGQREKEPAKYTKEIKNKMQNWGQEAYDGGGQAGWNCV